jgi:DNA-binding Xre family transcriptional regulator
MLYFNFTRIFRARGIDKPSSYMINNGFSESFATKIIKNGYRKIDLNTIERICLLFKCTPNDLLNWVPDSRTHDPSSHPLATLIRKDNVINLTNTLNTVTLDKLLEIEKIIQEQIQKP